MKPDIECGLCLLEWVYDRAISQNGNKDIPPLFKNILHLLSREMAASANVGALCNRAAGLIYEFVAPESEFWEAIKRETNEYVRELLPQAAAYIKRARTPRGKFQRACSLAAMGNVSPIGAPASGRAFAFPEALAIIAGKGPLPVFIGDACKAVSQSTRVLYLTDNAGEIGFDALLVTQLKEMGKDVTVVVKKPAYFEDATLADAAFFNLEHAADRIVTVNKVFVPENDKSAASRIFRKSDLVISKGTGNYEALRGETRGKQAMFLLKIKCAPIARSVKIDQGRFAVIVDK